jgi:hypothetical protein
MSPEPTAPSTLTADEYLTERVDFKIERYRRKGNRYRFGYLAMASMAAVAAAAVPVLINLPGVPKLVPTLLSLLVTILVGLEGLLHFREHWKNYDRMKSLLRQEATLFRAGAGPYRQKASGRDAFVLFVERIEEEIAKERAETIEMRTARNPEKDQPRDPSLEPVRRAEAGVTTTHPSESART